MVRPSFVKALNTDSKMTIKDWLEEIFCYNKPVIALRKVGRFFLRVKRYAPVLWNQEDWDYEGIYSLLERKMKDLRKNVSEDIWHVESEVKRELKQIDICLYRLDQYLNRYVYMCEYLDKKYTKEDRHNPELEGEQIRELVDFEEKCYNKFWKSFIRWHRNWWT